MEQSIIIILYIIICMKDISSESNSKNRPPVTALDVKSQQVLSREPLAVRVQPFIAFRAVKMLFDHWLQALPQLHWQSRHWCLERVFALKLRRTSCHFHWRVVVFFLGEMAIAENTIP